MKQPRVKIIAFNEQEIKDIINYFSHPNFQDTRNKAILSVFFDTGIRCEEPTSLLPEQIYKNHILINGKGSKQRIVPLSPGLAKAIQTYVRARTRYQHMLLPCSHRILSFLMTSLRSAPA